MRKGDDLNFEKVKMSFKKLVPLMVELSIHRDFRLFFRSLNILKRYFYLNSTIKDLMLSLSLYDSDRGGHLAKKIES